MALKVTGRVLYIGNAENLTSKSSGNTYTKRDLVITLRKFDQYTGQPTDDDGNTPKFTFMGERCKDLDQFKVGDIVTVSFEINGRSFVNRDGKDDYLTDLRPIYVGQARQTGVMEQQAEPSFGQSVAGQPMPAQQPYNPMADFPPMPDPYPQGQSNAPY